MSEEAELWEHVKKVRQEERAEKEPNRIAYAVAELSKLGLAPTSDEKMVSCRYGKGVLRIWPYTGYWACRGLGSGRGIKNLLNKLKG